MKHSGPYFKARFLPTWQGSSLPLILWEVFKGAFFPSSTEGQKIGENSQDDFHSQSANVGTAKWPDSLALW